MTTTSNIHTGEETMFNSLTKYWFIEYCNEQYSVEKDNHFSKWLSDNEGSEKVKRYGFELSFEWEDDTPVLGSEEVDLHYPEPERWDVDTEDSAPQWYIEVREIASNFISDKWEEFNK
jgi:hypothetical protein